LRSLLIRVSCARRLRSTSRTPFAGLVQYEGTMLENLSSPSPSPRPPGVRRMTAQRSYEQQWRPVICRARRESANRNRWNSSTKTEVLAFRASLLKNSC